MPASLRFLLETPDPVDDGGSIECMDPTLQVDPAGEALHSLRMSGAFYCRSELRAPFAVGLPPLADTLVRLGYGSEAAFSGAFERAIGTSPGAAHRRTAEAPAL